MTITCSPITGGFITPLVDAATIAWPANQGFAYSVTLAGNRAMAAPVNATVGTIYTLTISQDGTGSRLLTWPSTYRVPTGKALLLSTIANAVDVFMWFYDGTNMNLIYASYDVTATILAATGLTASTNQVGQITLNWTNNSPNAATVIPQFFDGASWSGLATLGPTAVTYIDTGLPPGSVMYRIYTDRGSHPNASWNQPLITSASVTGTAT